MRSPKVNYSGFFPEGKPGGARVIAIASGKGGVGKTNLVVNLAVELNRQGYRVAIFDADLGMANVEVLLGIVPKYTLYDYLFNGNSIEEVMSASHQGIQVISGGSGFVELANLDPMSRKRLGLGLQELDKKFDYVLVDTGAGISKTVLGFVASSDEVIVVVTPEPTSLTDAYGLIKVLSKYNIHNKIMVVINLAGDDTEAQATYKRLETTANRFLEVELVSLGYLLEDSLVVKAVKNQVPFTLMAPSSKVANSIGKIAHFLVTGKEIESLGIKGFFGKLMRLFG